MDQQLLMAARTGNLNLIKQLVDVETNILDATTPQGNTALHMAARFGHKDFVEDIMNRHPNLVHKTNLKGETPFHVAAKAGQFDVLLLFKTLHLASKNGQVSLLKLLLNPCPDTVEMIDTEHRNILHLCAKNGFINVVMYVLDLPEAEDLVNASDSAGNTPLHLAAMNFHSNVIFFLSRNSKVDIRLTNQNFQTALDVVYLTDHCGMELQKHLTLKTLKSSYTKRAGDLLQDGGFIDTEVEKTNKIGQKSREMATPLLLMATLIATFTFTAAFTIPGGFRNNDPNEGMPTLISKSAFKAFIVTDSIAFTSSMTAAVLVFWSSSYQVTESFMDTLPFAIAFTWIALVAMALAFVTGLFVVLSKTLWLAILVCVIGCAPPAILYIFGPLFLLVFDRLSSSPTSLARRRNILEDNPFLFIVRLTKMTY